MHLVDAVVVEALVAGAVVGEQAGVLLGTMSGSPSGLAMPCATSMRKPSTPAVQPEPHRLLEVGEHLGVGEVQVGLLRREQVQVPLAVGAPASTPGRRTPTASCSAARCRPGRGRRGTGSAPARASPGRGQRRLEPLVAGRELWLGTRSMVTRMPERVRLGEQRVELGEVAEHRLDVPRVGDVVAVVGHRARGRTA